MDLGLEIDFSKNALRLQEFKLIGQVLMLENYFTGMFRTSSESISAEQAHTLKRELIASGIIDMKQIDRWYTLNVINRHLDEHDVIPLSFLEYCLSQHLTAHIPLSDLSERYGISEIHLENVIRKALSEGYIDTELTEAQITSEALTRLRKSGRPSRELKYQAVAAYRAKVKSRKEVAYEFSINLVTLHRWDKKYGDSKEVALLLREFKTEELESPAKRSEMSDQQKLSLVREYYLREVHLDVILEKRKISRRGIGRIVKELLERKIITDDNISEWVSQRIKLVKRSAKKGKTSE